jgi:hypothetical protein
MTHRPAYLAAALRLYLDSPGAPKEASRADWAVAQSLHQRATPLEALAHAIRLATLRRARLGEPLEPVRSLAYYRRVLDLLTPAELGPGYVDYVHHGYRALLASLKCKALNTALSDRQNPALSGRR